MPPGDPSCSGSYSFSFIKFLKEKSNYRNDNNQEHKKKKYSGHSEKHQFQAFINHNMEPSHCSLKSDEILPTRLNSKKKRIEKQEE